MNAWRSTLSPFAFILWTSASALENNNIISTLARWKKARKTRRLLSVVSMKRHYEAFSMSGMVGYPSLVLLAAYYYCQWFNYTCFRGYHWFAPATQHYQNPNPNGESTSEFCWWYSVVNDRLEEKNLNPIPWIHVHHLLILGMPKTRLITWAQGENTQGQFGETEVMNPQSNRAGHPFPLRLTMGRIFSHSSLGIGRMVAGACEAACTSWWCLKSIRTV
jgi:hypothetical protein